MAKARRGTQPPRDDPPYAVDAPPPEGPCFDLVPTRPFFVWVRRGNEPDAIGERYSHQIKAWDALDGYERDLVGHGADLAVEIRQNGDAPVLTPVRRSFLLAAEATLVLTPGACSCGRRTYALKLMTCPRCSAKKARQKVVT